MSTIDILTKSHFPRSKFLCGICKKILQTPVILTEKADNVCKTCFDTATVEIDINNDKAIPNTILDELISGFKFPCKYANEGCQQIVAYEELIDHENNCNFIQKPCVVGKCHWMGTMMNFLQHFVNEHNDLVVEGSTKIFTIFIEPNKNIDTLKLLKGLDEQNYAFLQLKYYPKEHILFYKMYCDSHIEYKLKFKLRDNKCIKIKEKSVDLLKLWDEVDFSSIKLDCLVDIESDKGLIFVKKLNTNCVELDKNLLKLLECPHCKKLMKPPIYQDTSGHGYCANCIGAYRNGSYCNNSKIRNYNLEAILQCITHPCIYHNLGCATFLCSEKIGDHEKNCFFKRFMCPEPNCTFGERYDTVSMLKHLQDAHSNIVTESDSCEFKILLEYNSSNGLYLPSSVEQVNYLVNNATVYKLTFKTDIKKGFASCCINDMSKNDNKDLVHIYELSLITTDNSNNEKITVYKEIFRNNIFVPNTLFLSYCRNNSIRYCCKILK